MRQQLLELLRQRSFERKQVVLASGKQSDFFIDCKQAVLTAQGHALVGALLLDALDTLPACDGVAGVALGGCPLASAVSLTSHLRGRSLFALYVRKDEKDHGSRRHIEGDRSLAEGQRIALVEDVVTTGASTCKAIEKLRDAGAHVVGVIALVDRLEGGAQAITEVGVPLLAIFTRDDFLPS